MHLKYTLGRVCLTPLSSWDPYLSRLFSEISRVASQLWRSSMFVNKSYSDQGFSIHFPEHTAFPIDLDPWLVSVKQIRNFARQAWDSGVKYLGLCCGNRAHYIRALAEEIGRTPPASRYTPDMSQHYSRKKGKAYDFDRKIFEVQLIK